jgi:hypothetical protein
LRDIGEARIALNEPAPTPPAHVTAPPVPRRAWAWVAAVCAAAAITFCFLYLRRPAEEPRVIKLHIPAAREIDVCAERLTGGFPRWPPCRFCSHHRGHAPTLGARSGFANLAPAIGR